MGIFSKLFGGEQNETVIEVEAKIAELDKEEASAHRTNVEIDARYQALLISGDDKQLDADAIARVKAARTLERSVLARQELSQRLVAARERARQVSIIQLRKEQVGVTSRIRDAMLEAVSANEAAQLFHEKCRGLLGGEANAIFPTVAYPLLRRGMLEPWEAYLDQLIGPKPRVATPGTSATQKPAKPRTANPASGPAGDAPRRKRGPQEPLLEAVPPGHIRCTVLRSGFEAPTGEMLSVGDLVDLPNEVAGAAMKNGAVDRCPAPNLPEL
jgi:hypothetical protein